MPTYDYRCGVCDEAFELRRPMSESAEPATCPVGHEGARRLLSVFAALGGAPVAGPSPSGPPMGCGAACACHPG
ncbi:MAG TPA: FmdB family transcriptional regulator [Acidimicrobiaceae bacterium]|nr:FmdB family transcriptional regulator [Acidimicrobiaceae bacterium]HCV33352.1 FmdB family transcriptional regulator [Acidimicrobiaceae bacterium]